MFMKTFPLMSYFYIAKLGFIFYITDRSKAIDTSVTVLIVLCFGVEFLCCLSRMYVSIFLVQFGLLSGRLLGNSCSLGLRHVFGIRT